MGAIASPGGRAVFSDTPAGLAVTIPAERSAMMLLFLGSWIAGWAVGEGLVIRQLFFSGPQSLHFGTVFLMFWLAGWTFGGLMAIRSWLWNAFGKERLVLRPATLTIKREILGIGRERRYDLPAVSNLRVVSPATGSGRIAVAFDHAGDTVYFGDGLGESEAAFVAERLKTRHAFR